MRLIVYGDIHGCFDEFCKLRDRIKPEVEDLEICAGDMINKGPDSKKLISFIEYNNIKALLGNHEVKLLKYRNSLLKTTEPPKLNQKQKTLFTNLDAQNISFLASLPYFIKVQNITVLHGGVWRDVDLQDLDKSSATKLAHTRYLDKNGKFISLEQKDRRYKYWADMYEGEQGFIVYGHQVFKDAKREKHSLGLDTGCVYGNKLSAGVFHYEDGWFNTKNYLVVEQESKKDYTAL
jgi:bis(5'-nucleosyl)-tetraphosphatase (symmetrical)